MPLMLGWFVPPRVTSCLLANPTVSRAAEGGVVWGREVACGAVSGKSLARIPDPRDRRLVVHSDGHLGRPDAAGAQTITDGPFARVKGGDADAPQPGFVPRVASSNRCGSFSASPDTCE